MLSHPDGDHKLGMPETANCKFPVRCDALCFFFFSSRRRHTRLQGDWSSDVCSSDLNGTIVSHTGNTYVVQGASWNTDIAAGQSTDFGFTASPGGAAAVLSNFVLTGTVDRKSVV